jgi:cell wall-associated NlpC family hydrolase
MGKLQFVGCHLMLTLALATLAADDEPKARPYQSPYSVKFSRPLGELLADIQKSDRADPKQQATVPFTEWYSADVRKRLGAWGPRSKHYPAPEGVLDKPADWKRERTIAVGLRFLGYGYQHHHIPDWDPPADWPWKKTSVGRNGKGVDCSDFTSFVYNLGFGLRPNTGIKEQAALKTCPGPGPGKETPVQRVALPNAYADMPKTLKTGDLLFIRKNAEDEIAHVVLWIGAIGQAPDRLPLILDSHGDGVKDAKGVRIPAGIQLRPFRENSWYFRRASHALRVWPD